MTTAELAKETRVHRKTILKMVARREISADPVGGSHGFEFDESAILAVKRIQAERHADLIQARRKAAAKARRATQPSAT